MPRHSMRPEPRFPACTRWVRPAASGAVASTGTDRWREPSWADACSPAAPPAVRWQHYKLLGAKSEENPVTYPYPPAELKAPEGTNPYTPWIWLIVVLPLVATLPALGIDWGALVDLTDTTGMSALGVYANPLYWVMLLGGWAGYGLSAWFAYLDWRELQRRGVPSSCVDAPAPESRRCG